MDRRPPLAVSPRRLRPRTHRAAAARPPVACSVQTPPGSIKKSSTPMRSSMCALPTPRLEPSPRVKLDFAAAPSPARAAGKENRRVDDEVALDLTAAAMNNWTAAPLPPTSPLFERGRLYDLYSARRNERLKRKHGFPVGEEAAEAMATDPCVAVELSKRRGAKKTGAESVRRSMPSAADFSACRATTTLGLRSSLRSSKEMKKASAASFAGAKSSAVKERRASTRSSARRF
ncbi:hypothetical protein E2562_026857 [Oryza meyeriana var. granulata]|uniref:Uncharacterized protein n=1 Tax=Oryza meyeriana var. granulata TaxID=110450 RepID=A0A6G1D886_9ORYZ|nr:hypothetical protein E2562_026857 [Oryza meyeriana var. granulata]